MINQHRRASSPRLRRLLKQCCVALSLCAPACLTSAAINAPVSAQQAQTLAKEAYVFGLPLVYIQTQSDIQTHVTKVGKLQAPLNQFVHYREFPNADNKTVVGLNVDTLYSLANLDLSREPMVLFVPPMGDRFWIMQLIDAWNNVPHAPGSRTLGGKGGTFAIVGPDWRGTLPKGMTELRMPTSLALLGGRTYTAGTEDYAAVHALQDQYKLVPLSAWGNAYTPPDNLPLKPGVDSKTPVPAQVDVMPAQVFFQRLNALMVHNPPYPADSPVMTRIAQIGIKPGVAFDMQRFTPQVQQAIERGVAEGRQAVHDEEAKLGKRVNGWNLTRDMGRYGTQYTYRAAWTYFGVGGNLIEDAFYPLSLIDGDGKPYDAAHRYVLHFTKEQLPPVNAFWSLTMYDKESYLVPNTLNRYALGDRSHLTFDDDGSLTLYIQKDSPGGDKKANWLPTPAQGGFKLALRLYAPKSEVTNGEWVPPAVKRID
ncbi:hypothetical protein PMI22_00598 [Pseudomonas sp. GM21]|uniref:DUF1254 domain-containing protein n=1 Tax=Pseudomonas sp. GM21 TaxID=1144325 RepID=UPI000272412E|nr:DUF1254 domain-containing protein [Pseudomonas sp. GM21]EJM24774.1 hypothetical protein PMI22_00598 [Pseudomonas sp. GM21]